MSTSTPRHERPTPLTDAAAFVAANRTGFHDVVSVKFGEDLEQRLAEAEEALLEKDAQITALRRALESIHNLGCGPDKGTVAWQAESAHGLAAEALAAFTTKHSLI